MFEIHFVNGQNCPVIVCDICGEQLKDAATSAVVFNNTALIGSRVKALYVHKGHIDNKTCHAQADSLILGKGGDPGWQEMKTYLADLTHNIGFPPSEIAEYDKQRSG
jgi:hypothetical protein